MSPAAGARYGHQNASAAFSPLDLSPVCWWDFSDTATITASAGRVSQVDDKSGNGNHLVQATAGNQPLSGSVTKNGLNVLHFATARKDYLETSVGITTTPPFTIYAVVNLNSVVNDYMQMVGIPSGSPVSFLGFPTTAKFGIYGGSSVDTGTSLSSNAWYILGAVFNGASSKARINGSGSSLGDPGAGTFSNAHVQMNLKYDGNTAWEADYSEIVITDNDNDSASLYNYLNTKWAVY